MRKRLVLAALVALHGSLLACAAILGIEPPMPDDGGADAGEGGSYATIPCVLLDAQVPDAAPTTWYPFNASMDDDAGKALFAFFDLSTLGSNIGSASLGFAGGAFDGKNVYFVATSPSDGGLMLQHPVAGAMNAWSAFDFGALGIPKQQYQGASFDGRYVYYASRGQTPSEALRYDTQADASFSATTAWTAFDVDSTGTDAGKPPLGFSGAVFDGRYVYFVPFNNGTVARYDTKPPVSDAGASDAATDGGSNAFASAAHWSTFDTSTLDNRSTGFEGAVFDGRFVYLVPFNAGVLERYDTTNTKGLGNPTAWSSYELDTLPNAPKNFAGAVYDGHYVYLVPHTGHITLRYDSAKGFTGSAFTEFDIATVLPAYDAGAVAFNGGAFDGRFVYYVSGYDNGSEIIRYDTLSPFTAPCAWEGFALSRENAQLGSFFGAVYDGQYLYYVPTRSMVVRYETKGTSAMPPLPQFMGSFF